MKDNTGLFKNLKSISKIRSGKDLKNHVINTQTNNLQFTKDVIFNRKHYSPQAIAILDKYGNQKIKALRIYRVPLSSTLMNLFDVVTFKAFSKRMEDQPYDKLFHLRLDVRLENNVLLSFEKTEHVIIAINPPTEPKSETMVINIIPDITFAELCNNTQKYMGINNFFRYSSRDQNCQDFIMSVLTANNSNNAEYSAFIKQDTKVLFDTYLRKLANTATDLAGRVAIVNGSNIVKRRRVMYSK